MRRVELLDTSVMLNILGIPGKAGQKVEVEAEFERRRMLGTEFILPIAAVVEVGVHIERLNDGYERRTSAQRLAEVIRRSLDRDVPWSFDASVWSEELLRRLIEPAGELPRGLVESLATGHLQMGDLLIVGEFLRRRENVDRKYVDVDVWTFDRKLEAVVEQIRAH